MVNSIGVANLDGSAVNQSLVGGAGGPVGVAVDSLLPPNAFSLIAKQLKKKNGTAVLIVSVPGPGQLALTRQGDQKPDQGRQRRRQPEAARPRHRQEDAQAEQDRLGEGEGDTHLHPDRRPPAQQGKDDQARQAPRRLTLKTMASRSGVIAGLDKTASLR